MKPQKIVATCCLGIGILAGSAGFAAEKGPQDVTPSDMDVDLAALLACMETGIDTDQGRVGCFQPVIAVIGPEDESIYAGAAEPELQD